MSVSERPTTPGDQPLDDAATAAAAPSLAPPPAPATTDEPPETDTQSTQGHVQIRSLPAVVHLYPTALAALACALWTFLSFDTSASVADQGSHSGLVFLCVFAFNHFVFAYDFTRSAFLALVFFFTCLILGGVILESQVGAVTSLLQMAGRLHFFANTSFYLGLAAIYALLLIGVLVRSRFDYWELQHNELLHHQGFVGDVERFSAQTLRWTKEIPDVFEFCLLGSGRLVIYVKERERPIVLQNVPRINHLEKRMATIQATVHVKINDRKG